MPKQVDEQAQIARIVQATCTVLAARGLEGFNLRAVAQEAGCTTGLLMHWFSSKAELVQAALAYTVAVQNERVTHRLATNPQDVLGALAEFLPLDPQRQAEARIWLSFLALAVSTPTLMTDHQQRYAMFRQEIIAHLKDLEVGDADLTEVANRLIVLVDGICVGATLDLIYWTPQRQLTLLAANIADVIDWTQHTRSDVAPSHQKKQEQRKNKKERRKSIADQL
jgi:TetR/AcrR family transcriptional regulator, transcriptional repressor of bet genes